MDLKYMKIFDFGSASTCSEPVFTLILNLQPFWDISFLFNCYDLLDQSRPNLSSFFTIKIWDFWKKRSIWIYRVFYCASNAANRLKISRSFNFYRKKMIYQHMLERILCFFLKYMKIFDFGSASTCLEPVFYADSKSAIRFEISLSVQLLISLDKSN